jgi:hypothetical protein
MLSDVVWTHRTNTRDHQAGVAHVAAEDLTGDVGTDDAPPGDALGDDCSRSILVATSCRPMTAKELTERCVVSPTTVYRRINALADRGLLEKRVSLGGDGGQTTVYEPTFARADLRLTPEGVCVETFDDVDDPALLVDLVSRSDAEEIDLRVEDGEITVSISPTDDLLRALGRALRDG